MKNLNLAFQRARRDFTIPVFDSKGQKGNKFASLKSIHAATYNALDKQDIELQFTEDITETGLRVLITKLVHIPSGEERVSQAELIVGESKVMSPQQEYGASLTYAKRYSAMTILGLYADDADLDYVDHTSQSNSGPVNSQDGYVPKKASESQLRLILSINRDLDQTRQSKFSLYLDKIKTDLNNMSSAQASQAIEYLNTLKNS